MPARTGKFSLVLITISLALGSSFAQLSRSNRTLLLQPDSPQMNKRSPELAIVRMETTKGVIRIEVHRA